MALPKGVKSPVDYTRLYMSNELDGDVVSEKKMTKKQMKKRDEIADAISKKDMKDRYDDEDVRYAIGTKLAMKEGVGSIAKRAIKFLAKKAKKYPAAAAVGLGAGTGANLLMMKKEVEENLPKKDKSKELFYKEDNIQEILDKKDIPHVKKLVGKLRKGSKTHAKQADDLEKAMKENTAIESELVIQDWNSDDIKFTEIETVDIIKAKPLKENVDLYEGFKTRMIAKFGKKLIKNIGRVNPFTKTGAQRVTQGAGITKKYIPPDKVTSQNIQTKSVVNQAKKMVDLSKKPNKGTKAVKVDLKKPIDFDKYLDKSQKPIKKKFIDKRPTGTFTDDLPPANNPKGKNPLKDHYDWRTEIDEDWQKINRKDKTDGLSRKAVKAYRRENPGSKLQTAVTKDPKKLKKGSKSAKRRLSFCRRMKGMKKKLTSAKTRRDPDSRINKALRRWNC